MTRTTYAMTDMIANATTHKTFLFVTLAEAMGGLR
jgi:hypothetical protein